MLDPARYSAGVDQYFIGQMFEQLVRFDPDLKPVNWLAEVLEDRGHGGQADHRRADPQGREIPQRRSADLGRLRVFLRAAEGSEDLALDAPAGERREVRDRRRPSFQAALQGSRTATTSSARCSSGRCRRNTTSRPARTGSRKAPVGTGPWKFVSRTVKEDFKLEAFDDYWNKDARPKVKNLVLQDHSGGSDARRRVQVRRRRLDRRGAAVGDRGDQEDAGREDLHRDGARTTCSSISRPTSRTRRSAS